MIRYWRRLIDALLAGEVLLLARGVPMSGSAVSHAGPTA
jgi:hypothetical protein